MVAGGGIAGGVFEGKRSHLYEHRFNSYFGWNCILGSIGGFQYGYNLVGVTSRDDFLGKFFPKVLEKKNTGYCSSIYDDQLLTLFTSSLYFSALFTTFFASYLTQNIGRKPTITVAALFFCFGSLLGALSLNFSTLFIARLLLGAGIGFGNQAIPLYLSEIAPAKIRGAVNHLFHLTTCVGILFASVINHFTQDPEIQAWRISLAYAFFSALIMLMGGMGIAETPYSLVEQGRLLDARSVLERVRGTDQVDAEFQDLKDASAQAKAITSPFRTLFKRKYMPQLVIGALGIPAFQQLTGANSILFHAPLIFHSLGFGNNASIILSLETTGALIVAAIISIFLVDKFGRRNLFLEPGFEMICCMICVAVVLALEFGHGKELSKGMRAFLVLVIFLYVLAYGRSWGPLGWLVPSELFPPEIRSAAQSIVVSVNMIFTALVAQLLPMSLCHLKYGTFLLFGGLIVLMSCFIFFLLPETNQVPIDEIYLLFEDHWFWKKFAKTDQDLKQHQTGSPPQLCKTPSKIC